MLLDHPYIRVPKLCCNDRKWYASHREAGSIGMAETVKGNRRDFGRNTSCRYWALLVRCRPFPTTAFGE